MTPTPSTVSKTTLDWYEQLGPWEDADENSWMLLALCDSIGLQYDVTEQYTRDDATHVHWGQLLDVNVCPTDALPWLAQFAGVTIAPNMTDAQMRAAIVAQQSTKRGTVNTLVMTAQAAGLTGTKRVDVIERTPDPYSFKVITYGGETPGGAGGSVAAAVLAALTAAKPAGLIMVYSVQAGLDWSEMANYPATTAGRWEDQTDTWASLSNDVPVT